PPLPFHRVPKHHRQQLLLGDDGGWVGGFGRLHWCGDNLPCVSSSSNFGRLRLCCRLNDRSWMWGRGEGGNGEKQLARDQHHRGDSDGCHPPDTRVCRGLFVRLLSSGKNARCRLCHLLVFFAR